ncbi:MAG: alkaline phosphatase D family protein [Kofleriaceae bacterium]
MTVPTRRDFMRIVGAGAATLAAGSGTGCDAASPRDAAIAVLEPSSRGFVVVAWARLARTATVEISLAGEPVRSIPLALAESGSGHVAIGDLAPGVQYDVAVTTPDGLRLGSHRVRTAPADDDARPVAIAVLADVDPDPEFDSDLIGHLIAASPDLVVSLGDFPYTDNGPEVAQTLEAYRDRHVEIRTLPKVRGLLESCGVRAIYDDHEFRNDWDAGFVAAERARYAAAMTVWDEFFPLPDLGGEVRYRSWRWGKHVECFLLDCRRFRSSREAADDGTKTMLGAEQLAWLISGARQSTASFKLVLTSVPLDFGVGPDHWGGYRRERDALFEGLLGIPGILFVSADQHWFASHRHAAGIRELQIGPLARGIGVPPPAAPGVLARAERYNVGLLEIGDASLTFAALGAGGERFYEETLTPDQLTPRRE